jgi:hypothetical protein
MQQERRETMFDVTIIWGGTTFGLKKGKFEIKKKRKVRPITGQEGPAGKGCGFEA